MGKVRLIKDGADICLISYGPIMKMAFEVAERIEQERGLSVAIVSAHTIKPLDKSGIANLFDRFETVAVVEEHSERGGLAAEVKKLAWEQQAKCRLHTFSLKDEFIHEFGSHRDLLKAHGLTPEAIYDTITAEHSREA